MFYISHCVNDQQNMSEHFDVIVTSYVYLFFYLMTSQVGGQTT